MTRDRRTSAPEVHSYRKPLVSPHKEIQRRPHAKSVSDAADLVLEPSNTALSPTELFSGSSSIGSNLRHSMGSLRRTLSWNSHRQSPAQSNIPELFPPLALSPLLLPFQAFSEKWRPLAICQVSLVLMTCATVASIVYDFVDQFSSS
jgi:hypothetical protein